MFGLANLFYFYKQKLWPSFMFSISWSSSRSKGLFLPSGWYGRMATIALRKPLPHYRRVLHSTNSCHYCTAAILHYSNVVCYTILYWPATLYVIRPYLCHTIPNNTILVPYHCPTKARAAFYSLFILKLDPFLYVPATLSWIKNNKQVKKANINTKIHTNK